jgi:hypothetical protein
MASQIIRAGWFGWNPAVWPHVAQQQAKAATANAVASPSKTKTKK